MTRHIRYPLTRGAVILRDLLLDGGKTAAEIGAAIGAASGSGVSSWTHGRWRPNEERRAKLEELYGIPAQDWETIVREPTENDMRAMLQERVEKRKRAKERERARGKEPAARDATPLSALVPTDTIITDEAHRAATAPRAGDWSWKSAKYVGRCIGREEALRNLGDETTWAAEKALHELSNSEVRPLHSRSNDQVSEWIFISLASEIISQEQATAMLKKLKP